MTKSRFYRNDKIIALCALPLYIAGIGRYGLKIGVVLVCSLAAAFLYEYAIQKLQKKNLKTYGYTTAVLLPLFFPPGLPVWMSVLSVVFGILISVTMFGGHGHQLASPVALGWSFGIISFSTVYDFAWSYPYPRWNHGFSHWNASIPLCEHPMNFYPQRADDYLSRILTGAFPQSPGSVFPVLVLCLGIVMLFLKAVDFRSIFGFLITYLLLYLAMRFFFPLKFPGYSSLLVGNTLLTLFFVLGDQRIAARTFRGRWLTGILAGVCAILIRGFSSFPGGVLFAVLLANVFSGIIDFGVMRSLFPKEVKHAS